MFLAEKAVNASLRMRTNLNNKFAQSCREFKANSNSNELYFQLRKPTESFEGRDKSEFSGTFFDSARFAMFFHDF